ncbi:MAG: MlaD family protein [Tannerellaceae bacterium]|nr:MlaD family protein [Tannerellaceae bacterium]
MKLLTKEAKIGIVTIISLALLYIGINYLKGINLFKPVNHYYVKFDNVKDVTVSSPVYVEGFKVGLVRSITYNYQTTDDITVEISLDEGMHINKGSNITIVKSLLSGGELHINLNKNNPEFYKSGATLEGRMGDDMLETVQEKLLPGVEALLPKIDSILTSINNLLSHEALGQSLTHIQHSTANLEQSTRVLNGYLSRDVPVLMENIKTTTENFATISGQLTELDFRRSLDGINATLDNLTLTTNKLNSNDNTLGLLLNDRRLYENLNSTASNAASLFEDIQANPKRYVRFSVF